MQKVPEEDGPECLVIFRTSTAIHCNTMKASLKSLAILSAILLLGLVSRSADPTMMVLLVSWQNPPGGVSPTGFVLQKAVVTAGNTNWAFSQGAAASATNILIIQAFTAAEIDWRLAATNFYGTSEWAYARSPVPTPGVGEVPKAVINLKFIRK